MKLTCISKFINISYYSNISHYSFQIWWIAKTLCTVWCSVSLPIPSDFRRGPLRTIWNLCTGSKSDCCSLWMCYLFALNPQNIVQKRQNIHKLWLFDFEPVAKSQIVQRDRLLKWLGIAKPTEHQTASRYLWNLMPPK